MKIKCSIQDIWPVFFIKKETTKEFERRRVDSKTTIT